MRVLIQRVKHASVTVERTVIGEIKQGLLVFLGIEASDTEEDSAWILNKLISLRIFNDSEGKMNLSCEDVGGDYLIISQFTLHASTKKGNRPSFIQAAKPDVAEPMYDRFIGDLISLTKGNVAKGSFGADMQVALINDGPVTIWIDSKQKE